MLPPLPLVSIITVTYNAGRFLEQTMESVFRQTYPAIEYIIIDGGSTDETLNVIRTYNHKLAYWHSKKDNGTYDAMNQGIQIAKGETLLLLNAGDWIEPQAIEQMIDHAQANVADRLIACDWTVFFNPAKTPVTRRVSFAFDQIVGVCHQGILIGKNIYTQFGLYDTSLKFLADYDFYLRVWKKKPKAFIHVPLFLTHYRFEGMTTKHTLRSNIERWTVINRHFAWYEATPIKIVTLSAIGIRSLFKYLPNRNERMYHRE